MNKHTPGPWHVILSDNATPFIQHEGGADWSDIDDRSSRICHMPAEIMENFNSFNNAKLIAAAPDLLEALECLIKSDHDDVIEMARAAIARARGEA